MPDANAGARGTRFVRACAVEMHMDVSQEPFGAEIDKENAESPGNHFEWTLGPNPHRKNPKCGHIVWGKIGHGYRNQFAYRDCWWTGKTWIEMNALKKVGENDRTELNWI